MSLPIVSCSTDLLDLDYGPVSSATPVTCPVRGCRAVVNNDHEGVMLCKRFPMPILGVNPRVTRVFA